MSENRDGCTWGSRSKKSCRLLATYSGSSLGKAPAPRVVSKVTVGFLVAASSEACGGSKKGTGGHDLGKYPLKIEFILPENKTWPRNNGCQTRELTVINGVQAYEATPGSAVRWSGAGGHTAGSKGRWLFAQRVCAYRVSELCAHRMLFSIIFVLAQPFQNLKTS